MATGWLGWVPEVVLNTPIIQLEMALEAKIDFVKKTNPFGGDEKESEEEKLKNQVPNPEIAAKQLMAFVGRFQAHDARHKTKPLKEKRKIGTRTGTGTTGAGL